MVRNDISNEKLVIMAADLKGFEAELSDLSDVFLHDASVK